MATKGIPDPEYILRADGHPITSIHLQSFSPGCDLLISGTQSGTLAIWDLKRRNIVKTWNAHHEQSILTVKVLTDNTLLTHGRDGFVHLWKYENSNWSNTAHQSIRCKSTGFCPVTTMHINSKEVIIVPCDNNVEIISMDSSFNHQKITSLGDSTSNQPSSHGMCMMSSFIDETMVLIGYEDGNLILWDIRNNSRELYKIKAFDDSVMALSYNSNINKGVLGSVTDTLKVFSINKNDNIIDIINDNIKLTNPGVNCLTIRSDGKLFVNGGWDSQARLFSCKKYNPLAVLGFHTQSIQCVDFAEDNTLAIGSRDGAISMWNLYK